ncbi:MAG: hypothetical protein ABI852_01375 [Gemmatimonadaceae bacterium]
MNTLKRLLIGTVLTVLIVAVTLASLEGGASLLLFERDYRSAEPAAAAVRDHYAPDTLLGWTGKAAYANADEYGKGVGLTIDSSGRRITPQLADSSSPARRALVCSGDSYTFGLGVDDAHTWCSQLPQYLPNYRAFNMGQTDYGLDQSALWFQRGGAGLAPAVHILAVTDGELERATAESLNGRGKPYFELKGDKLELRNTPVAMPSTSKLRSVNAKRELEGLRVVQLLRTRGRFDRDRPIAAKIESSWPLYEKIFERVAAVRKDSTTLVIAYLPIPRDRRPGEFDKRREKLSALSSKNGIKFVDLTPEYRALRADSADLVFITAPVGGFVPNTGLYSNLGHQWIARTLSAHLQTLGVAAGDNAILKPRP